MTWKNPKNDCMLCHMEKKTKWYKETDNFVVAEKLSGDPFIVIKDHVTEINDDIEDKAHSLVDEIFGDHTFEVRMGQVEDHWHAHIITDEIEQDLKNE